VVRFNPFLLACCFLALATATASAQERPLVRFELKNKPSLRFGSFLRVNLLAKVQLDGQTQSPSFETDHGDFDVSRFRAGIDGEFLKDIEYQVEREFRGELQERDAKYPWRDVFINLKYLSNFQLKAGKFKVPFGMEALTSEADLEFVARSRVADDLSPGRDIGAALHGRFYGRLLGYQAGVFRNDGEKSDSSTDTRGGTTVAARFTSQPLRLLSLKGDWDEVEFGFSTASSDVDEGLTSLRGRTVAGTVYFPHVYVQGRRSRFGTDVSWRPGPFSIQGEFIRVREARENQSVRATDLPDKISQGWYITTTWAVTGESKEDGIRPRHSFPSKGKGAFEVALRFEQIDFKSAVSDGEAFRSPRAPNLLTNGDRVWTAGLNWYLNRYVRIQINGVRESLQDVERSPVPGRNRLSTGVIRLQFAL